MVNAEEVLDPRALSLDELRALRNRLQMEDDEVSYVRRVAQARVDLVRAEAHRRDRGENTDDLSSELRVVLSTHLTGGTPRPPRPVAAPGGKGEADAGLRRRSPRQAARNRGRIWRPGKAGRLLRRSRP